MSSPPPAPSLAGPPPARLAVRVLSDIHHAGPRESQRHGHELRVIRSRWLRLLVRLYRHYYWLRDPFAHNNLLDTFLRQPADPDWVVANGDYSCDTGFVGLADDAAFESARLCLASLRARFGDRLRVVLGDHELGKKSLFGGVGGLRLASWQRITETLHCPPCWDVEAGRYVLVGVTSSLVALPVYRQETLADEWPAWERLRALHLEAIARRFATLAPTQRVILFCHDPTALPFLAAIGEVRPRLPQIALTVIGHLHSPFVYWQSRVLAGLPAIGWLGHSIRRMSTALRDARHWRPFRVQLCPALAGIELLKDGGYLDLEFDPDARSPIRIRRVSLPRPERKTAPEPPAASRSGTPPARAADLSDRRPS